MVVCRLTPLQIELYKMFCKSNNIDELGDADVKLSNSTLSAITQMKKLCNRKYSNNFIFQKKYNSLVIF